MQYRVTTLWDDISPRLRTLMTVVVALVRLALPNHHSLVANRCAEHHLDGTELPSAFNFLSTAVLLRLTFGSERQEIVHYGTSQKRDYVGLAGWTLADCFPALSGVRGLQDQVVVKQLKLAYRL